MQVVVKYYMFRENEKPEILRTKWNDFITKLLPLGRAPELATGIVILAARAYTGIHSRDARARAAFNSERYRNSYRTAIYKKEVRTLFYPPFVSGSRKGRTFLSSFLFVGAKQQRTTQIYVKI